MPSKRYSPAALVCTVRVAPLSLLVKVTSADLITACVLSVMVPCKLEDAVTCAHILAQPNSMKPARASAISRCLWFISLICDSLLLMCRRRVVAAITFLGGQTLCSHKCGRKNLE